MTTEDYRRAFETAKKEFEALGEERRAIDRRLGQLAQTMASLSRLCGYVPTVSWGLTDGCRMVLMASGRPMTPTDVRDALGACGFDMSKYTNDLAAVHTVLKRLNDAGEARFIALDSGKHAYVYSPQRGFQVFTAPSREAAIDIFKNTPAAVPSHARPPKRRKP
jgi:hypothetical protein